jgi:hypothetical protein
LTELRAKYERLNSEHDQSVRELSLVRDEKTSLEEKFEVFSCHPLDSALMLTELSSEDRTTPKSNEEIARR